VQVESTTNTDKSVKPFHKYIEELKTATFDASLSSEILRNDTAAKLILNGRASAVLQQTVPVALRRKEGIFFTSSDLSERISSMLSEPLKKGARIADPACGAGNLLVACANRLPLGDSLEKTIEIWSDLISGCDLFEEFVLATKLRLTLLAAIRTRDFAGIQDITLKGQAFPKIRVADIFTAGDIISKSNCIVFNPPFGYMLAPEDYEWTTGKIQKAAVFFDQILHLAHKNQQIIAILPDVLRSGTRYKKWREAVNKFTSKVSVDLAGRFDNEADVDVFILQVMRGRMSGGVNWSCVDASYINDDSGAKTVSDLFDVYVGPVVPHRDQASGPSYPFIHARTMPAWKVIRHVDEERKYEGTTFKPPFVTVHRTSSPRDRNRCVGTIINMNDEIAVENHLLVLVPKDHSLERCNKLLANLRNTNTNEWMNNRICCRHITVPVMKELPWWGGE